MINKRFIQSVLALISMSFILFSSCKHSDKYKTQMRQIDSLLLMVDTNTVKLKAIDTTEVGKNTRNVKEAIRYFEKNNRKPITYEITDILAACGNAIKPFEIILHQRAEVKEELEETRERLHNLKHDMQVETVKEADAMNFLQDERIASQRIYFAASELFNLCGYFTDSYKKYYPKLVEINKGLK